MDGVEEDMAGLDNLDQNVVDISDVEDNIEIIYNEDKLAAEAAYTKAAMVEAR